MEPMFSCRACFRIYEKRCANDGCAEDQKSTTYDDCGEKELTFPIHWILDPFEIEHHE